MSVLEADYTVIPFAPAALCRQIEERIIDAAERVEMSLLLAEQARRDGHSHVAQHHEEMAGILSSICFADARQMWGDQYMLHVPVLPGDEEPDYWLDDYLARGVAA